MDRNLGDLVRTGSNFASCRRVPVVVCALVFLIAGRIVAREPTDKDISMAVSDALVNDVGVSGYLIDVAADDGVVTLSGASGNLLAKQRAVRVAETVKGVRAVINEIRVKAPERPNVELKQDIEAALLSDPVTESYEIEVSVDDGEVTLSGTVHSWQEKQVAGNDAKGVTGVMAVDNLIDVEYVKHRSDNEIQLDVQRTVEWDALVDDALIDVRVSDGTVTLSGVVGSAAEKRRARWDAWVTGVGNVKTDHLRVESWAREKRFRAGKYGGKTDEAVEQAVADALLYDPRVKSFDIDVAVTDGIVTLLGTVDNLNARRAAARDARNTVGAWRVKNYINVRTDTTDDLTIKGSITQALERDPYLNRRDVKVTVDNGEVTLRGSVDTYFEKAHADDIAAGIDGVITVHNNLDVQDKHFRLTYDPYVDGGGYLSDFAWYAYPEDHTVMHSDWAIKSEIEDKLWWSPFVDSDEVHVAVKNGVATLTGTVDTWKERLAATENAYDGGALAVDNELKVNFGPGYYQPQAHVR
jgi:osmotically-inducible protein OsmY